MLYTSKNKENLIDELIITIIPVLLGGGTRLFGDMPQSINFDYKDATTYLNSLVQIQYIKKGTGDCNSIKTIF